MDVRKNTVDQAHQGVSSWLRPVGQEKSGAVGAGISTEGAQEMQKVRCQFGGAMPL